MISIHFFFRLVYFFVHWGLTIAKSNPYRIWSIFYMRLFYKNFWMSQMCWKKWTQNKVWRVINYLSLLFLYRGIFLFSSQFSRQDCRLSHIIWIYKCKYCSKSFYYFFSSNSIIPVFYHVKETLVFKLDINSKRIIILKIKILWLILHLSRPGRIHFSRECRFFPKTKKSIIAIIFWQF